MNAGHMHGLIERGDVQAVKEAMEQSLAPESRSFEQSLYELLQKDAITREDALSAADSKNNLLWLINNAGKPAVKPESTPKNSPDGASYTEFTLNANMVTAAGLSIVLGIVTWAVLAFARSVSGSAVAASA